MYHPAQHMQFTTKKDEILQRAGHVSAVRAKAIRVRVFQTAIVIETQSECDIYNARIALTTNTVSETSASPHTFTPLEHSFLFL